MNNLEIFTEDAWDSSVNLDEAVAPITINKTIPTKEAVQKILDAKAAYEAHPGDEAWQKKHFLQCPWGIAFNISTKGKHPDINLALMYYLIATLADWKELSNQLARTVKQTYRVSKRDIAVIASEWQAVADTITDTFNSVTPAVPESLNEEIWNGLWPNGFMPEDFIPNTATITAAADLYINVQDRKNGAKELLSKWRICDAVKHLSGSDTKLAFALQCILLGSILNWEELIREAKKEASSHRNFDLATHTYSEFEGEDLKIIYNRVWLSNLNIIEAEVVKAVKAAESNPQPHKKMYRITVYDKRYNPPARRHIYITKTRPNGIRTVALGGAEMTGHTWYDEPLFDSAKQAQDFLDKINTIQSKSGGIGYLFGRVTDKPVDGDIYNLDDATLVNTDLGPAYIHNRNGKINEDTEKVADHKWVNKGSEGTHGTFTTKKAADAQRKAMFANGYHEDLDINEDIEKHDELNPKLFNEDGMLKDEVRAKIEEIVTDFTNTLAEDGIKIAIDDIILIGSNVSYNYTKDSDLDIHIIANTKNTNCPDNLYPKLYSAYRSLYNKAHDISFYGIPVEIYVETEETNTISNGIYSVRNNKWIKEPVQEDIPDIDMDEFNKEFAPWEERYNELIAKLESKDLTEAKRKGNWRLSDEENQIIKSLILQLAGKEIGDKKNIICHHLNDYKVNGVKSSDLNNIAFIKNNTPAKTNSAWVNASPQQRVNALHQLAHIMAMYNITSADQLADIINNTTIYIVPNEAAQTIIDRLGTVLDNWLRDNVDANTKTIQNNIKKGVSYATLCDSIDKAAMQMLRKFKAYLKEDGLSAIGENNLKLVAFDDGNTSWQELLARMNAGSEAVAITTTFADEAKNTNDNIEFSTFSGMNTDDETGEINKIQANSMANYIREFIIDRLKLPKDLYDSRNKAKKKDESLTESEETDDIDKFIEDIYDLRKSSLPEGGEYSIGNLIFKEVRNRGWLDNLKELRNKSVDKDLSLEQVKDPAETEYPLDEAVKRQYLTNRERDEVRIRITQAIHTQPIIQDNGIFQIYNVKENDLEPTIRRLRNLDFVDQHQLTYSASGKYNFNSFNPRMPGMPERYFTIRGKVIIPDEEETA